jgi:hypothetical protein
MGGQGCASPPDIQLNPTECWSLHQVLRTVQSSAWFDFADGLLAVHILTGMTTTPLHNFRTPFDFLYSDTLRTLATALPLMHLLGASTAPHSPTSLRSFTAGDIFEAPIGNVLEKETATAMDSRNG